MAETQIVSGIHLPSWDTHFRGQIEKGPLFLGKGTYQFQKIEKALGFAKRRGHAVDIGAQVGLWSRVLAAEFRHLTAFEPMPDSADCFAMNLAEARNVVLYRHALGSADDVRDTGGKIRLSNIAADIASGRIDASGEVEAEIKTLDSIDLPRMDFLKIDVEGFDFNVIRGAYRTIRRDKPIIVVEQKGRTELFGGGRFSSLDLLKSWGAEVLADMKGDYVLGWPA